MSEEKPAYLSKMDPDKKDVRKNGYHLKRGYYAMITVDGFEGFILIDYTDKQANPVIVVQANKNGGPEVFEMTDQVVENFHGAGFAAVEKSTVQGNRS